MFNLNGLSDVNQRERFADLIREAERERLYGALERRPGRRHEIVNAMQARWRHAAARLPRSVAWRRSLSPAVG